MSKTLPEIVLALADLQSDVQALIDAPATAPTPELELPSEVDVVESDGSHAYVPEEAATDESAEAAS